MKFNEIEFTTDGRGNSGPYIIALFGEENVGKTRLPLTGPEVIGYVPLEMKSYATLEKDEKEFGKKVLKPKDPTSLLVPKRRVDTMANDIERQKFYIQHVQKIKETTYAMLENKDVKLAVIDKFTTFCVHQEYAINGLNPKLKPINGIPKIPKSEVRQSIIDFINCLSQFDKTVILNCASKGDYDVVDAEGNPLRNTWDSGCLYMLGSHANIVCELATNPFWDAKKKGPKFDWKYALNVRKAQKNPVLEGPEGNPLLKDDMVSLPYLIQAVEGDSFDLEKWI